METKTLATREQIIAYYNLTSSELDGIDIENIIKRFQLTLEDIKTG